MNRGLLASVPNRSTHLDVEVNKVVLVEDVKTKQGLPQEGVHAVDLEPLVALQLFL